MMSKSFESALDSIQALVDHNCIEVNFWQIGTMTRTEKVLVSLISGV